MIASEFFPILRNREELSSLGGIGLDVDWRVRPVRADEAPDTAESLRRKAREFARLAAEARDPVVILELRKLVDEYDRQAAALEA